MIKKLRQPIVIELEDDSNVTVSHHGLVNISQEYKVNALYTSTFRLSLLSNQLDTAGYTSTFARGKCSISSPWITITGNRVNDLNSYLQQLHSLQQVCLRSPLQEGERGREKEHHRVHIPPYHQSRTPPRLPQAHRTPPLWVQPAPYLNVHLPPYFQSPLRCLSQSQNHTCGIAVQPTFILLPYNFSLVEDHQRQDQAHNKAIGTCTFGCVWTILNAQLSQPSLLYPIHRRLHTLHLCLDPPR